MEMEESTEKVREKEPERQRRAPRQMLEQAVSEVLRQTIATICTVMDTLDGKAFKKNSLLGQVENVEEEERIK